MPFFSALCFFAVCFILGWSMGEKKSKKANGFYEDRQKELIFYQENFGKIKNSVPLFSFSNSGNSIIDHVKDNEWKVIKEEADKVGANPYILVEDNGLLVTLYLAYDLRKEKEEGLDTLCTEFNLLPGKIKEKAMQYC
jgi:hypothetical protein